MAERKAAKAHEMPVLCSWNKYSLSFYYVAAAGLCGEIHKPLPSWRLLFRVGSWTINQQTYK